MALFKRADLEAQGLSKEQIEFIMTESGRALSTNYTLKSDVQAQVDAAVNAANEGDTVILSPACASFDAFKNFETRGNCFKELVAAL